LDEVKGERVREEKKEEKEKMNCHKMFGDREG
jgi:hypothetical protein